MKQSSQSITIDGVEYTRAPSTEEAPLRIIVADRGWVFLGHALHLPCGGYRIRDARVVRRWGTSHGLGQLAQEGPLEHTVIEALCPTLVPAHSVVAVLSCREDAWS